MHADDARNLCCEMTGSSQDIATELRKLGFTFTANPHGGQVLGLGKRFLHPGTMLHVVLYPSRAKGSSSGCFSGAAHYEPDPIFTRAPKALDPGEVLELLNGLWRFALSPHKESVAQHLLMAGAKMCIDRDGQLRVNGAPVGGRVAAALKWPANVTRNGVLLYADYQEGTRRLRELLRGSPLASRTRFT